MGRMELSEGGEWDNCNSIINRYIYILKRVIQHDQECTFPEIQNWLEMGKSINVIHHIKRLMNKNHMIISINVEKVFDKIEPPFITKTFRK